MSVAKENWPTAEYPGGVQLGLYKVRLKYERDDPRTVPARFNTETVVGQEVSYDDPGIADDRVTYSIITR
jgi:hypothetical protein